MITKASVAVIWKWSLVLGLRSLSLNSELVENQTPKAEGQAILGMLNNDALNNIGHVLASIDRSFELFVHFFPL